MPEEIIRLCRQYTDLSEEDQALVLKYAETLPAIARLCGADVFLDCLCRDGFGAVVVAEARQEDGKSLYRESVVGERALPEKEPGVFHAFETGKVSRDLRAVSQENVPVQQNVVPIFNDSGHIAAVLIREENIQKRLDYNHKYEKASEANQRLAETLASLHEAGFPNLSDEQYLGVQLREMSHRIKNNLQMLASIMSMESRRCHNEEAEAVLRKNVARMLTVADFHDTLSLLENRQEIDLKSLLFRVVDCARTCMPAEDCEIDLVISGDDLTVPADLAGALLLVVNELVTNSIKHAFPEGKEGRIEIEIRDNSPYRSIIVTDNGIGSAEDLKEHASLGLHLVEATVHDKIKGVLNISSGTDGSGVSIRIDF